MPALSSARDHRLIIRRWLVVCVLAMAAGVVLSATLADHPRLMDSKDAAFGESYRDQRTGKIRYLYANLHVKRRVFCGVTVGVVADVQLDEGTSWATDTLNRGTRDDALAGAKREFASLCTAIGCADAADVFDAAAAAPDGVATKIDWWRYVPAVLHGMGPYVLACGFIGVLVCWWWEQRWRAREARGECIKCGYDLRGIGAGVCPECGTANGVPSGGSPPDRGSAGG